MDEDDQTDYENAEVEQTWAEKHPEERRAAVKRYNDKRREKYKDTGWPTPTTLKEIAYDTA